MVVTFLLLGYSMSKSVYFLNHHTLDLFQSKLKDTKGLICDDWSVYLVDNDYDFGSISVEDLIIDLHNENLPNYPSITKVKDKLKYFYAIDATYSKEFHEQYVCI